MKLFFACCLMLTLVACGGGGGGSSAGPAPADGLVSADAPPAGALIGQVTFDGIEGIAYQTLPTAAQPTALRGITDEDGRFVYFPGQNLDFAIGEFPLVSGDAAFPQILLAQNVVPKPIINLIDFDVDGTLLAVELGSVVNGLTTHEEEETAAIDTPFVNNRANVLISLDNDDNAGNGISLSERVRAQVLALAGSAPPAGDPLGFSNSITDFDFPTSPFPQVLEALTFNDGPEIDDIQVIFPEEESSGSTNFVFRVIFTEAVQFLNPSTGEPFNIGVAPFEFLPVGGGGGFAGSGLDNTIAAAGNIIVDELENIAPSAQIVAIRAVLESAPDTPVVSVTESEVFDVLVTVDENEIESLVAIEILEDNNLVAAFDGEPVPGPLAIFPVTFSPGSVFSATTPDEFGSGPPAERTPALTDDISDYLQDDFIATTNGIAQNIFLKPLQLIINQGDTSPQTVTLDFLAGNPQIEAMEAISDNINIVTVDVIDPATGTVQVSAVNPTSVQQATVFINVLLADDYRWFSNSLLVEIE